MIVTLTALDKTFDERRENFRRLFDNLDAALISESDDAGAQVSEILGAIAELAQTSPFKDLKSPALVVQEFLQGGKVIELRRLLLIPEPTENPTGLVDHIG